MGGPRAKNEEERRQRLLEAKRKSYRRSVARKRQMTVLANQEELREESQLFSDAWDMHESVTTNTTNQPMQEEVPIIDAFFSLLGTSRASPQPSSPYPSHDSCISQYETSDDDCSSITSTSMSDGEPENPEQLPIPSTWNYDIIQDEEMYTKRLHSYYDEVDVFLGMDDNALKGTLKTKAAEIPGALGAVEVRRFVACQVASLERMFQRVKVQGWDKTLAQMVTTLTAEYRRSVTLAHVHQSQVEFLRAGLEADDLEQHLDAFREWWVAALPELHQVKS